MNGKLTWLSLGKAGPSNDARQQRVASYKRTTSCFVIS